MRELLRGAGRARPAAVLCFLFLSPACCLLPQLLRGGSNGPRSPGIARCRGPTHPPRRFPRGRLLHRSKFPRLGRARRRAARSSPGVAPRTISGSFSSRSPHPPPDHAWGTLTSQDRLSPGCNFFVSFFFFFDLIRLQSGCLP